MQTPNITPAKNVPEPSPRPWEPPKTGFYSLLPVPWIPYAELIRFGKPAGTIYLYIPILASTLLAAAVAPFDVPVSKLVKMNLMFALGSTIFRGAACTWNDILDQDIDRKVSRTRNRPLPRGAISTATALLYNAIQIVIGSALMSQLPPACQKYSVLSIIIIGLYPLGKRITHYPQVILGFTWAYGFVMGFPAMDIDPFVTPKITMIVGCLYGAGFAWTIGYDTVYAHQDIRDDKREGVKSIAIKFEAMPKTFLTVLAFVQVALFMTAGYFAEVGPIFYVGGGFAAASLACMIATVDLEDPESCGWWFHRGSCSLTGGSMALACLSEYVRRFV